MCNFDVMHVYAIYRLVWVIVFNTTFNNISVTFLLGMLYTIAIQFYVKYYSYTTSLLYYTRYPVLVKEVTDNIYCISFRTQCPFDQYIRRVVKHITCAISMSSRIEEVKDCIHITLICGSLSIVWHIPDYIEMQCCELD